MPAIETAARDVHLPGREGQIASGRAHVVETYIADEDIGFGLALVRATGEDRCRTAVGVVDGSTHEAESFVGISVMDRNLRIENTDPTVYKEGDPVRVLTGGEVWVKAEAAVAVGDDVTFDADGNLSSAAAAAAQPKIVGARWMSAAGVGGIARVFIPDFKNS